MVLFLFYSFRWLQLFCFVLVLIYCSLFLAENVPQVTTRLRARDFRETIVDAGEARILAESEI